MNGAHERLLQRREALAVAQRQSAAGFSLQVQVLRRPLGIADRRATACTGWHATRMAAGRGAAAVLMRPGRVLRWSGYALQGYTTVPARAAGGGPPGVAAGLRSLTWRPTTAAARYPVSAGQQGPTPLGRGRARRLRRRVAGSGRRAAEACRAERNWRHAYPTHMRRLVELQARSRRPPWQPVRLDSTPPGRRCRSCATDQPAFARGHGGA